jgi:hypothetical protein
LVLLVLAGVITAIALQRRESPQARRDDLVARFVAVVSDSLDRGEALQEIHQLFYTFYVRADMGKVAQEDVDYITDKLASYVDAGRIGRKELDHFMAEVGYRTYKNDPRYNPDSTVDHPVLNPQYSTIKLRFDSTDYDSAFLADFEKWRKEHEVEFSDTARSPRR